MAQMIKLRRSAVAGRIPTTANLELGELAINVRDGKIFFKRDDNTIQTILTTNTSITGDLTLVGDITGSDVYIDDWGSISGSLAAVQAGHFDPRDVETVYSTVHNTSGGTILKGTPLAVVAGQTSGNVSDVVPADAADPALMPAAFIANEDILDGDEGEAIVFGRISGIDTSAFSSGDKAYVAPGGGWTTTKPVHPNKIQNLGIITKSHATNGGGVVMGAGRSNDVPNLTPGKVWVGTATYPTEATSIHLDEANGRLGINALTPGNRLTVHDASQNYPVRIGNNTANVDGSWTGIAFKNSTNTGGGSTYEDSAIRAYRYSAGHELELRVNDTSALRINAAGNVGIGTTSPSHKLHVVNGSNTLFVTRDVGTAVRIGIGETNPSYAIDLGPYSDNAIGGIKYLRFYNGTDRLDVSGNGRFAFKAGRGYYFYPTTDNPSYDAYGVAIRHLRDSAANTNDDVLLVEQSDGTDLFKVKSSGNVEASGNIAATGAITSNGVDVLDNAVAMAIALG